MTTHMVMEKLFFIFPLVGCYPATLAPLLPKFMSTKVFHDHTRHPVAAQLLTGTPYLNVNTIFHMTTGIA